MGHALCCASAPNQALALDRVVSRLLASIDCADEGLVGSLLPRNRPAMVPRLRVYAGSLVRGREVAFGPEQEIPLRTLKALIGFQAGARLLAWIFDAVEISPRRKRWAAAKVTGGDAVDRLRVASQRRKPSSGAGSGAAIEHANVARAAGSRPRRIDHFPPSRPKGGLAARVGKGGALLALCALAACASTPKRAAFTSADLAVARVIEGDDVRFWTDDTPAAYRKWGEALLRQRGTVGAMRLLALSGGSDKGAYSAGLLNGWTERGSRPVFDIVTGVSTGALIAPFAFLGSAEDRSLTSIYTGIDSDSIFRPHVLSGLLGGSSLLDTKPLQALIARHVTPAFLARIAAEHRRGRRLLVLTTNLDAQRGVVWDMGAIAASGSPRSAALFRDVLLASASIPGAFPPVMVDVTGNGRPFAEMHVDGGAIGGFFVMPRAMLDAATDPSSANGAVQILYNGRIAPQFEVVKPKTFDIMSRALSTVLGEIDRSTVADLRRYARERRIAFSLCAIGNDFGEPAGKLFDPAYMRALYDYGLRTGKTGGCLAPEQPRAPEQPK
ncbi:hypothetical protein DVW87_10210 [Sphingomonas aracearum]|uniref:PNPLA domain-containing protein n=2 Tax=Sphingomonas aracearum TaxID=2283317 RepID=A0A369VT59_9SPHN|nr:hypothetical protein DVW87_10210 [Sphingomonas aracearum]